MPQHDKHRTRVVPIEFEAFEQFTNLPLPERLSLVQLTNGEATIKINNITRRLSAPCILCVSQHDQVTLLNSFKLAAKSFSFNPVFLNSSLTFEALENNNFIHLEDEHDRNILFMFLRHSEKFSGIIPLPSSMFLVISEWIDIIGTETYTQSDGMWTCRIRRYLLQTLYLINDIYTEMERGDFQDVPRSQKEHVEIALEYIHTHYQNDIPLDRLCNLVNLNRTSLNYRFKEKTGHTATDYLIHHRIKIACEALIHTNLKIIEISESCGFKTDTYFIKQFTKKMNVSPSEYRQNFWNHRKG